MGGRGQKLSFEKVSDTFKELVTNLKYIVKNKAPL